MLTQIFLASIADIGCIFVMSVFIGLAIWLLERTGLWFTYGPQKVKLIFGLAAMTLWLLAGLSTCVWIWAMIFMALGIFAHLEEALYFSVTAFTTLGFGDIILPVQWRLLAGFAAAGGLLLFSLGAAFLFEAISSIRRAQINSK